MEGFLGFYIKATGQGINEFVVIDEENSHFFQIRDIRRIKLFFWCTASSKSRWENYIGWGWANGCWTFIQRLQACNILDNFYAKSVILEGELYSAEIQAVVSNNYGKLQFGFNNFRNILKKTRQR